MYTRQNVCLLQLKSDSDNQVATSWLPHYLNWCACVIESDLFDMLSPTGREAACQTAGVTEGWEGQRDFVSMNYKTVNDNLAM